MAKAVKAATNLEKRKRARNAKPKIERAALQLFVSEGVEAATTRRIAEEAGVSEGALYRHYEGKDELALALFMETHIRLGQMMMEALSGEGTLEDKVRNAVTAYCKLADEDFLLFSFHLVSLHKFLPYDTKRTDDPVSVTENIIKSMMDMGTIPEGDASVKAAMCLGLIMQTGQNKIYNRVDTQMSDHIGTFTKAIMAILQQD